MVNLKDYEYDLAFSFSQEDEPIAKALYDLLRDRVKCFIYTEEQKKLAGRDGESVLNKVFSKSARLVVIIQNANWGKTPWTRIEETAIRNRGYDHGYDYVVLIPSESPPAQKPEWFPKHRIWLGLKRLGLEAASAIIEERVKELDGVVHESSLEQRTASRFDELERQKQRQRLLDSPDAVVLAAREFEALVQLVRSRALTINDNLQEKSFKILSNTQGGINIWCQSQCLTVQWYQRAVNSLVGAYLKIDVWDGYFNERLERTDHFYKYRLIVEHRKQFEIDRFDQHGWSDVGTRAGFVTSNAIAEAALETYFSEVLANKAKFDHQ